MRSRFLLRVVYLALIISLLAAGLPFGAPTALACSCGGTMVGNAASADYVVVGAVASWQALATAESTSFLPIEITIEVERTLRGNPPDPLVIFEASSYSEFPNGPQWAGSSGACGTFDADPTGVRALYALRNRPDGSLGAGRCSGTSLGIGLESTDFDAYIAEVEAALEAQALPDTGGGPPSSSRLPLLASVALGMIAIAAISAVCVRSRATAG